MSLSPFTLPVDREPWALPVSCRVKEVYQLIGKKKIVLFLCDEPNTSTFRYRVYNIYQSLLHSKTWHAGYFYRNEINFVVDLLPHASVFVLGRTKWFWEYDNIIAFARTLKVPIVFDVDDLVFDLNYVPLIMNTLAANEDYDYWFSYVARIALCASKVDFFTCTNAFLGSKLEQAFSKKYFCIENSLNEEQIAISEQVRHKKQLHASKQEFVIGYFSGSPSHTNDFCIVEQEIKALLQKFEKIKLLVVGFMEFSKDMQPFLLKDRITLLPLTDFLNLQVLIGSVDVNIVPLVDNDFTNCKSELKFFESAIVDVPTCATPIYSYRHAIRNGENGFLCSEGQWYHVLADIYHGKINLDHINSIAKNDVLERYSGDFFRNSVETVYDSILDLSKKEKAR